MRKHLRAFLLIVGLLTAPVWGSILIVKCIVEVLIGAINTWLDDLLGDDHV